MARMNVYNYFNQTIRPGVRPYKRISNGLSKREAQIAAKSERQIGNKARVVREADGYVLWVLAKR